MNAPEPLRVWVTRDGRSERAIAEVVGMNHTHLWAIMRGKSFGSLEVLERIAGALSVPAEQICEFQMAKIARNVNPNVVGQDAATGNVFALVALAAEQGLRLDDVWWSEE